MRICVIIPAYNEVKTIGGLTESVKARIPDVIVVDDGSVDGTGDIARKSGAIVLGFSSNKGKGEALKAGFKYALENSYNAVITMDADGQHSPEDIMKFIDKAATAGIDLVVGNRMADPEGMPLERVITNFFMSFLLSFVCRRRVPDTQCGYRLVKCEALRKIRLISANYEIESELLIKVSRQGCRIASVPIKSVYQGQRSLINPLLDTWRFFVMFFRVVFYGA